jgi:hypothetical protein
MKVYKGHGDEAPHILKLGNNEAQEDTCLVCFYHSWQFLETKISGNWFYKYLILWFSGLCHCVGFYPEDEGRIFLQNTGICLHFYYEDDGNVACTAVK